VSFGRKSPLPESASEAEVCSSTRISSAAPEQEDAKGWRVIGGKRELKPEIEDETIGTE